MVHQTIDVPEEFDDLRQSGLGADARYRSRTTDSEPGGVDISGPHHRDAGADPLSGFGDVPVAAPP